MIQFNLLPDVKKEYVKAKRTKRLIMLVSFAASTASVVVVVLMFSVVQIAQKKHIDDLTKDIKKLSTQIITTEDLEKILTVQNQLSVLSDLHEQKPATSRLFEYVTFVSPQEVKVSTLNIDVATSQLIISGSADSIATINKFVDNILSVRYYTVEDRETLTAPFEITDTSLSGDNDSATFKITTSYDPEIFSNTQDVQMAIGGQTTEDIGSEDPQTEEGIQ